MDRRPGGWGNSVGVKTGRSIADHFEEMERKIKKATPADLRLKPSQIGNGKERDD